MKYIVANWKMNLGVRESVALARGVLRYMRGKEDLPELILCPSLTALSEVYKATARSRSSLGAQTCGPEYRSGAHTGEVSPAQLEDVHAKYVLIGHSERRHAGEGPDQVRRKFAAANASRLTPILCVGESLDDKESGIALEVVREQIEQAMKHVDIPLKKQIFVAYEPVWAIGSGETPDPGYIIEMHTMIRDAVCEMTGRSLDSVYVLYGGSVNDENAYQLLRESQVDGVLVGGASLKLQSFTGIIDAAHEVIVAQK